MKSNILKVLSVILTLGLLIGWIIVMTTSYTPWFVIVLSGIGAVGCFTANLVHVIKTWEK